MTLLLYGLLVLLAVTLIAAALSDLTRFELPNEIAYGVAGLFAVALLSQFSLSAAALHLASGLAVFAVTFAFWHLRLIAGGDVKLWAATALWFEWSQLPEQLFAVVLSGGLLALVLVAARRGLAWIGGSGAGRERSAVPEVLQVGGHLPYGVAISAGTLWALLTTAPGLFEPVLPGWPGVGAQALVGNAMAPVIRMILEFF